MVTPSWIIIGAIFLCDEKQTQHKMCNQHKNAIDWANRSVWVHHNLLQFLPYYMYMLYFRTTLLSGHLYYSWPFPKGDRLIKVLLLCVFLSLFCIVISMIFIYFQHFLASPKGIHFRELPLYEPTVSINLLALGF